MSNDRTLVLSTVTATIEKVDIADWLFKLPDAEYQRCSPAHIAAGTTTTDDGRPMSINVETVGDALIIGHYVAEVQEPHLCRMVSTSDFIMGSGRSKIQVEWKLSVKPIDSAHCEYSNHVHAVATDEFLAFLKKNGITLEQARAVNQALTDYHNREETPNFAKSLERRGLLR
jgi:hypothetical protein